MNYPIILTAAAAALLALASCSFIKYNGKDPATFSDGIYDDEYFDDSAFSNDIKTLDISVSDFNAIVLRGFGDVEWTQGDTRVSITGKEKTISRFIFDVSPDGTLTISCRKGSSRFAEKDVDIALSSPSLTDIKVSGAGDFKAVSPVRSNTPFIIKCLGAGDISLSGIYAPSVEAVVSGAGDIEIKRIEAQSFEANISGAGDIDAESVKVTTAKTSISGTGDIEIDRLEANTVSASVTGIGDIHISGRADYAELDLRGMGNIDIRGLRCSDFNTNKKGLGSIKTR